MNLFSTNKAPGGFGGFQTTSAPLGGFGNTASTSNPFSLSVAKPAGLGTGLFGTTSTAAASSLTTPATWGGWGAQPSTAVAVQQQNAASSPALEELSKIKLLYEKKNGTADNPYYHLKAFFYDFYMGPKEPGKSPQDSLSWTQIDANDEEMRQLLVQAMAANPDSDRLVPSLCRGPDGLYQRLQQQATRIDELGTAVQTMTELAQAMETKQVDIVKLREKCSKRQQDLSNMLMQATICLERKSAGERPASDQERLQLEQLEGMKSTLDDPTRPIESLKELGMRAELLNQYKDELAVAMSVPMTNEEITDTGKYLAKQQEALECLSAVVQASLADLQSIANDLDH